MGSTILDRNRRYELINRKQSFSFQKNRIGKGYAFKLAILLVITSILTWYSKQDSNNPLSLKSRIKVIDNNGEVLFQYIHGNRRKKNSTIVIPGKRLNCGNIKIEDNSWDLLSGHISLDSSCGGIPPKSWNVIDTSDDTAIAVPAGWPQPLVNREGNTGDGFAGFINPFADSRTVLLIKFNSIRCLFAEGSNFTCNKEENTSYKEKIELIVTKNSSAEQIAALRNCFRPRYLLVADTCPESLSNLKNVLCKKANRTEFSFCLTRRNTLKAE